MSSNSVPLLTYAAELLQSYSRLIVYSGDILRSLPEPREGLSAANIKPKKDESTAFLREWQHLEGVFDEYIIRLNNIRTRALEELEAARVRCLVGEDMDLTLPESVSKLTDRLEAFKKQYDILQGITDGGSAGDAAAEGAGKADEEPVESANVKTEEAEEADEAMEADDAEDDDDFEEAAMDTLQPAESAVDMQSAEAEDDVESVEPTPSPDTPAPAPVPASTTEEEPGIDAIDIISDSHSDAIAIDSSSDVDNDADMEEIFQ